MAGKGKPSLDNRRLLNELHIDMNFMSDFDPTSSLRNAKKYGGHVFDASGKYRLSGVDACDCLDNTCPGCHFPCPKCRSPKCGVDCRSHRKNAVQVIECDGADYVKSNVNIKTTKWFIFLFVAMHGWLLQERSNKISSIRFSASFLFHTILWQVHGENATFLVEKSFHRSD